MTPRNLFRVIVATAGLLLVGYGVLYLVDGLLFALGLFELQHSSPRFYAARGAIEMVIGFAVMRGIPPLVDIAFPANDSQKELAREAESDLKQ